MPFVVEYVSNYLTAARKSAAKKTITLADALDQSGERQACTRGVSKCESRPIRTPDLSYGDFTESSVLARLHKCSKGRQTGGMNINLLRLIASVSMLIVSLSIAWIALTLSGVVVSGERIHITIDGGNLELKSDVGGPGH
jgi:hypothetical protein